jgi:uncharacterized protein (TIRG00374 family)
MKANRWRLIISLLLTLTVVVLVYVERDRIVSAFALLRGAQPIWLFLALVLSFFSFFCTSLIYAIALRSLGYRHFGMLRVYAITIVALIVSQTVPAGGVFSYAFLTQVMRRRGVPPGHSTLLASLEAIVYVIALLIMFGFGIAYVTIRTGIGAAESTSLIALVVPVLLVGGAIFLLTRSQETLTRLALRAKNLVARILRRTWSDEPALKVVEDLTRGRELIGERPGVLAAMLVVEIAALIGHSIVMLLVLQSLGAAVSPLVVVAAFGIVMFTSTFNVLPGGGGTVEAVLVLVLRGLGVGDEAIPAAVIFRLLNFWIMVPVAAICYWLLMREPEVAALVDDALAADAQPARRASD